MRCSRAGAGCGGRRGAKTSFGQAWFGVALPCCCSALGGQRDASGEAPSNRDARKTGSCMGQSMESSCPEAGRNLGRRWPRTAVRHLPFIVPGDCLTIITSARTKPPGIMRLTRRCRPGPAGLSLSGSAGLGPGVCGLQSSTGDCGLGPGREPLPGHPEARRSDLLCLEVQVAASKALWHLREVMHSVVW